MLAHTKKLLTDKIILQFEGPKEKKNEAIIALKTLGFIATDSSVPWRDAFPEFVENEPGICLSGARGRKGITQVDLAKITGIPRRHISEMENNKRPIGKKTAKKLAAALDVNYRVFL